MKKIIFILTIVMAAVSARAAEKSIDPTACGITVGQTTKAKTETEPAKEVQIGDFVVEGLHMSVMSVEVMNDTVYQLSFFEKSPYADCWDAYKDTVYKIRDKYAELDDVVEPDTLAQDSAVTFFKTDGKTQIYLSANPQSITLILTNVHLHELWMKRLSELHPMPEDWLEAK